MSSFPKTEAEIIALCHILINGLMAHPDEFSAPPIKPEVLQETLNGLLSTCENLNSLHAQTNETCNQKKTWLQKLVTEMKHDIQYAERVATKDKLPLIGWSAHADPVPLQAPAQVGNLVCAGRAEDWISLKWDAPTSGGKPAVYHVQSREIPDGAWTLISTAFHPETTINNLSRGTTLEFRIEAANKQGLGPVSNIVSVVL